MSSPAYKIARFLEANFYGEVGHDILVSLEPSTPVETITVYDTGGIDPDTDDQDVFIRTIQIRFRTEDYNGTYDKMVEIRDLLINGPITDINDVWMQGDILPIGRDDNDRHLLTMNFRLLMEGN